MSWFSPPETLLPDLIRLNARHRATDCAVIDGAVTQSWQEFASRTDTYARIFRDLGLEKGDHVAVLMNNSATMLQVMFGAIAGGQVAVPLNVSVADDGIASMLADCNAQAVVASDEHVLRIDKLRPTLPEAGIVFLSLGQRSPGWLVLEELDATVDHHEPIIRPDDPCNVIYSSGTTGLPKGIVHSHRCRMAWACDMAVALRYYPGCRTLLSLGMYSNISWVAILSTLLCGGTLVIMRNFSVPGFFATVADQRISHSAMVPVQFQRLLAHPDFDDADLNSLTNLMCCGSPLQPVLKKKIVERFPASLTELYGLTEGVVTIQDPMDALKNPESVGKPCPGQSLKVIDENGDELLNGEAGEIVGHGRLIMSEYLNRADANAEVTWTDQHGNRWLRTGDIGRLDESGNLYLVDRKKDMIISGGQNIYPADIETVMLTNKQIAEVAVIGVASERWGETPIAVVVPANSKVDCHELLQWTNERVGKQQRIAAIETIDELPRNPNGKVLKRNLREQFADLLGGADRK